MCNPPEALVEALQNELRVQRGVAQMVVGMAMLARNIAVGTSTLTPEDCSALRAACVEFVNALDRYSP